MATSTPRLGLYQPADDGSEPLNVATDLNDNLERLDSVAGFVPSTSTTPPTNIFDGMATYETDTGIAKFRKGLAGVWTQLLSAGTTFTDNIILSVGQKLGLGTSSPTAAVDVTVTSVASAPTLLKFSQAGEANPRLQLDNDGLNLGPGGATAPDVKIYRPTANQISIHGSVAMDAGLSVSGGATAVEDLNVSGDLNVDGDFLSDALFQGAVTVNDTLSGNGIGVTNYLRRSADLSRASTATPAADTAFDYTLDANSTYFIEMFACYSGVSAGDFKCSWTVPSLATGPRLCFGMPDSGTSSANTSVGVQISAFASEWVYGAQAAGVYQAVNEILTLTTGASGGLLQFKWSQGTSNASATILRSGSTMRITKIA